MKIGICFVGLLLVVGSVWTADAAAHTFEIGESDFLLDSKPLKIHCGEIHYARIPRAYWEHRLKMLKAMGCNAVGCYMFWNFHERKRGEYNWEARADAAEFCRMAQREGLWVVLRPGPYACAEWEGGGAPWWLLDEPISMRSSDSRWLEPAKKWIAEVGRVLAPLQVTKGGPILMVQVENEYGLHGSDVEYIRALREATIAAGFEVPLYACNPPRVVKNGFLPELFQAANFGADPENRFALIREVQPKGPMMCSEYYPAWFDTWGARHNPPKSDREFFGPIDWMLDHGASFSLYMAHGGTSFGGWTGCRNPFVPNVTSYDYAAPIDEQGRANPSFFKLRERLAKHLNPGETLGEIPDAVPVKAYGEVALKRVAEIDELVEREVKIERPQYMETLGQGFGLVSYETVIGPEVAGALMVDAIHDFGYVTVDGKPVGILDRRHRGVRPEIKPATDGKPRTLKILVEAMGRINSSQGMEDRKGLNGRVTLGGKELTGWTAKMIPIDPDRGGKGNYRGEFEISETADTFVDMRGFDKGYLFVNDHNLGRYWKIGPQQTLYLPGCWLKQGKNEIRVLELCGASESAKVALVEKPILDELHPEADFNRVQREHRKLPGGTEIATGTFPDTDEAQVVKFARPVRGEAFTLQVLSSYDQKNLAAIAEFDFLDRDGNPLTSLDLNITGVDSEEEVTTDGTAENAIDGQVETYWLTSSRKLPHWIEFKTSAPVEIHGFRYTPKQNCSLGRIREWKLSATVISAGSSTNRSDLLVESGIPAAQGTHVDPKGNTIEVTTKTIRVNGKPTVGVMGEMHYSRVPAEEWRDYIRKMKEGGITTLATYVFWNHHEWEEGKFDFSGRRNLGAFLKVCEEESMPVVLRMGPWCHGEAREGGLPDWIIGKCKLRSEDKEFLKYVERFWKVAFMQVDGHLFKQGGCVVGVQIENECRGPWPYMMALKALLVKIGYDVPYYTRTGWPTMRGTVKYGEILPLFGDYADGFWERRHEMSPGSYRDAFVFKATRTSANIATEQLKASELGYDSGDVAAYPYLTCELGGGMPSSYAHRVVTFPMDALAMAIVKLGSGSNLLGYYMYAGGTNPNNPKRGVFLNETTRGKFTAHNDLPPFSYEFNAPISEFGERAPHFYVLKALHEFCAKYGEEFALEDPVIVSEHEAKRGRFVFHNDYIRGKNMDGDCWVGVERDGKIEKLVDGKALVAKYSSVNTEISNLKFRLIKEAEPFTIEYREQKGGKMPMQPKEETWAKAAVYELDLAGVSRDSLLEINYIGDVARLYVDDVPVADDFYKGLPMKAALWRYPEGKVTLRILPWQNDPAIYIQSSYRPTETGVKLIGVSVMKTAHTERP